MTSTETGFTIFQKVIYFYGMLSFFKKRDKKFETVYPIFLIIAALLGLFASFSLTVDKINLLKDPDYIPSCTVSPLVACSPVIGSDQASAFGFDNTFIGLTGFGMLLVVGVVMIAANNKLKLQKWFWQAFWAGHVFGILFVVWLISQSLFFISKLCLYCMLVWSITIPLFVLTTRFVLDQEALGKRTKLTNFFRENSIKIIILSYSIVILMILFKFWDYWIALFSQMNQAELLTNLHILELELPTTRDAVQRAYRRLAKLYHPDRGGLSAQFIAVKQAYDNVRILDETLLTVAAKTQQKNSQNTAVEYTSLSGFVQDDDLYWRTKNTQYYEPENPTMVGFYRAARARENACQKCVGSGIITKQTANPGGMITLEEFLCDCQKL